MSVAPFALFFTFWQLRRRRMRRIHVQRGDAPEIREAGAEGLWLSWDEVDFYKSGIDRIGRPRDP